MNQSVTITRNEKDNLTGWKKLSGQPVRGDIANEIVIEELTSWKNVVMHDHAPGRVEFSFNNKYLGHLHNPPGAIAKADIVLPKKFRDRLVEAGRVQNHITDKYGKTKWATVKMRTTYDIMFVIKLFRLMYEHTAKKNIYAVQ